MGFLHAFLAAELNRDLFVDFKYRCLYYHLLFSLIAFGIRKAGVIHHPGSFGYFRVVIMKIISFFCSPLIPPPVCFSGSSRSRVQIFSGGQRRSDFADVYGMTLAAELFVGLVLAANLAVVPMGVFLLIFGMHKSPCLLLFYITYSQLSTYSSTVSDSKAEKRGRTAKSSCQFPMVENLSLSISLLITLLLFFLSVYQ